MNYKALTTLALIVGSSSAALARPVRFDRRERFERHERNEHRRFYQPRERFSYSYYQPSYYQPSYQPVVQPQSWMPLMGAQSIGAEGRTFVRVDSQPGALHALRLDATSGDTFVNSIDIELTDGRHQVVTVGQELRPDNPSYEVALDSSCGIEDITVNGRSEYGGSIAMSAL